MSPLICGLNSFNEDKNFSGSRKELCIGGFVSPRVYNQSISLSLTVRVSSGCPAVGAAPAACHGPRAAAISEPPGLVQTGSRRRRIARLAR